MFDKINLFTNIIIHYHLLILLSCYLKFTFLDTQRDDLYNRPGLSKIKKRKKFPLLYLVRVAGQHYGTIVGSMISLNSMQIDGESAGTANLVTELAKHFSFRTFLKEGREGESKSRKSRCASPDKDCSVARCCRNCARSALRRDGRRPRDRRLPRASCLSPRSSSSSTELS